MRKSATKFACQWDTSFIQNNYCSAELNYLFNDPSRFKQLKLIAIEWKVDYLFLFVRMDGVRFIAAQLRHSREIWRDRVLKRYLAATMHLSRDTESVSLNYNHAPSSVVHGWWCLRCWPQWSNMFSSETTRRTKSILIWSVPRKGEPKFV